MISILYGPDGSGKSYYQMHVIVRELRWSRRNIVTNLAIKVPEFNSYLERKYPQDSINLVERLRILTADETKSFWDYRGPDIWEPDITVSDGDAMVYKRDKGENGVAFIIDEAGANGFSAAGWAQKENGTTRGLQAGFYLDQQRKMSDNVYASHNGNNPHGIAKPFRDKARDFVQLRNGSHVKMGIFKARALFCVWHYRQEPGPSVEHFQKEEYPLDKELADCYETERGTGIQGKAGADKGSKAKGIPVLWAFPMAIGIGSLCFIGPWALGHLLAHHVANAGKAVHSGVSRGIEALGGEERAPVVPPDMDPSVTVSGFAEYSVGPSLTHHGGTEKILSVVLSNGERYSSAEGDVEHLAPGVFKVDGVLYKYRKPVLKDSPAQQVEECRQGSIFQLNHERPSKS